MKNITEPKDIEKAGLRKKIVSLQYSIINEDEK